MVCTISGRGKSVSGVEQQKLVSFYLHPVLFCVSGLSWLMTIYLLMYLLLLNTDGELSGVIGLNAESHQPGDYYGDSECDFFFFTFKYYYPLVHIFCIYWLLCCFIYSNNFEEHRPSFDCQWNFEHIGPLCQLVHRQHPPHQRQANRTEQRLCLCSALISLGMLFM